MPKNSKEAMGGVAQVAEVPIIARQGHKSSKNLLSLGADRLWLPAGGGNQGASCPSTRMGES